MLHRSAHYCVYESWETAIKPLDPDDEPFIHEEWTCNTHLWSCRNENQHSHHFLKLTVWATCWCCSVVPPTAADPRLKPHGCHFFLLLHTQRDFLFFHYEAPYKVNVLTGRHQYFALKVQPRALMANALVISGQKTRLYKPPFLSSLRICKRAC